MPRANRLIQKLVKTFFILVKTNAKRKLKDAQLLFFGNTPAKPMCCRSKETDDIEHCSSIQRSPSLSTERVYQEYRIIFSPDYLVNCLIFVTTMYNFGCDVFCRLSVKITLYKIVVETNQ